jgi:hypothetical protein
MSAIFPEFTQGAQKLRFNFLFISIYQRQFGPKISTPYCFAISIISSSQSVFPISLNHADSITPLLIHF